jgi:hypothetical protein
MFKEQINDPRDFSLKYARQLGWLFFVCGLILGLLCIVLPIWQSKNGSSSASFSYMGAAISIIALCLAPGYIIGGRRFVELIWPQPGKWTLASILTLMVTCSICFGVFFGLRAYLARFGYSF